MIDVESATAEDGHRPSGTAASKSARASELASAETTALQACIINALL